MAWPCREPIKGEGPLNWRSVDLPQRSGGLGIESKCYSAVLARIVEFECYCWGFGISYYEFGKPKVSG